MLLGGSFQPYRVEKIDDCFSRYWRPAVVNLDEHVAVRMWHLDPDVLCPAMLNRVRYQFQIGDKRSLSHSPVRFPLAANSMATFGSAH